MATSPVILIADDGVHWYQSPSALGLALESPDVNAGIYTAFDATGRKLELRCPPDNQAGHYFGMVDIHPVTVHEGKVCDAPTLKAAIIDHLARTQNTVLPADASLACAIASLIRLQPADR